MLERFCLHCRVFYERMQEMKSVNKENGKVTWHCRRCSSLEYSKDIGIGSPTFFPRPPSADEKQEEEALDNLSNLFDNDSKKMERLA